MCRRALSVDLGTPEEADKSENFIHPSACQKITKRCCCRQKMWINCFSVLLIGFFSWSGVVGKNEGGVMENCTVLEQEDSRACYVCLGRDQLNCDWGFTCCKGSCFKLVDDKHNLIAKGCAPGSNNDGNMESGVVLDHSTLPWADNEAITGDQHFCTEGDYCNTANTLQRPGFNILGLLSSLGVLLFTLYVVRF